MSQEQDAPQISSPSIYLEDDEANAYRQHSDRIYNTVNPQDVFEEMWVQDIVDHYWEVRRLRKIKLKLLDGALYKGLEVVLVPLAGLLDAHRLSEGWQEKDPQMVEFAESLLKGAGLDMDTVRAETLALRIGEFEKIDRCLVSAELRRDKALMDIECHKSGFGKRLKAEADKIIEAAVDGETVKVIEDAST